MKQGILYYCTLIFCLAAVVFTTLNTDLSDYRFFVETTKAWLSGNTQLYDAEYYQFLYSPWGLLIFIPFTLIPLMIGKILYNILSLLLLFWIARHITKEPPWWAFTIALFNIYLILYLQLGQFDILILFCLILAGIAINKHRPWMLGVAFIVITMKPTNAIIPLLIIIFYLRKWPLKDIIRAIILPILAFLCSFILVGVDWLPRYINLLTIISHYQKEIPVITIFGSASYKTTYWNNFNLVGDILLAIFIAMAVFYLLRDIIHSRVDELREDNLYYALAINLVASPHLVLYHMVYLLPVITRFLTEHRNIGLLLIITTIIDLVFCYLGIGFFIFPVVILVVLLLKTTNIIKNKKTPPVGS